MAMHPSTAEKFSSFPNIVYGVNYISDLNHFWCTFPESLISRSFNDTIRIIFLILTWITFATSSDDTCPINMCMLLQIEEAERKMATRMVIKLQHLLKNMWPYLTESTKLSSSCLLNLL